MSEEIEKRPVSGWPILVFNILLYLAIVFIFVMAAISLSHQKLFVGIPLLVVSILGLVGSLIVSSGFMILQPNEAGVLLLFGKYKGTARKSGFWWVNPFYSKKKISLRLRTLNGEKLKVNDQSGNPIEIAVIVVWKVEDTFSATFEVDDYTQYVSSQSESALRHLASYYPYDSWEDEEVISLRGNIDEVSIALEKELLERLSKAGVKVQEARLSHLAYASEIAEAMLRRQQASAIISARKKIVEGAVSMVQMALEHLKEQDIVDLDDERKASMVSNLLVVLCSEHSAQPVVNTGTLYN